MFHFKGIPRGTLLEHTVLFRFEPSQISQQLRLGNQAHAPTQLDFSGTTHVPTSSSTRRVKVVNKTFAKYGQSNYSSSP